MKRNCSVYFRADRIYVLSMSLTTTHLWISNGYGVVLSSPTAEELTAAIDDALEHSMVDVALPTETITVPKDARVNGLRSWTALEKGAQPFGVRIVNGQLIVSIEKPYKSGGFVVEREETYPEGEIKDIGTKLLGFANV